MTNYFTMSKSIEIMTEELMSNLADHVIDLAISKGETSKILGKMIENLLEERLEELPDSTMVMSILKDVLLSETSSANVTWGDRSGNFVMVKRMPDASVSVKYVFREGTVAMTKWEHENPKYSTEYPDAVEDAEVAFDPRKRDWYILAEEKGTVVRTDVYVFFSDRAPGITLSIPVYEKNGLLCGVIGIDTQLKDISDFLKSLQIGKTGISFILDGEGRIIAYPDLSEVVKGKVSEDGDLSLELSNIEGLANPLVKTSHNQYLNMLDGAQIQKEVFFSFDFEKKKYDS
jgi:hypothetical protein